jgi:hypothetical protein
MSLKLLRALDRTMLLMRDELLPHAPAQALLDALTSTEVALVIDGPNAANISAQSAYVATALLMARSGHRVHLVGPDVPLALPQPPLTSGRMLSGLLEVGQQILPDVEFQAGPPPRRVDLEVRFGDARSIVQARRSIGLSATAWTARLTEGPLARWPATTWPLGALASSGLAAGEAFKAAMWRLAPFARNPMGFAMLFSPITALLFALAPDDTPTVEHFGEFDTVSAGAIANAFLYVLTRVPGGTGRGRVIDLDRGDVTNLNRNALFTVASVGHFKAEVLQKSLCNGVIVEAVNERYDERTARVIAPLAPHVLLGVDHIPTRWAVQRAHPAWLGIGATTHWSAMASFHAPGLPCAGCLHPVDDPNDADIPTVAFVSFWAGLVLGAYFLRSLSGLLTRSTQQTFLSPLRAELAWRTPVAPHGRCPVSCGAYRAGPESITVIPGHR